MQILKNFDPEKVCEGATAHDSARALPASVITIGFFDGIHRGHQAIICRAHETAHQMDAVVRVITFEEHPSRLFRPETDFHCLTSVDEKMEILDCLGVDIVHLIPFDETLARTPAENFCRDTLIGRLAMRALIVGHDFAMGQQRTGSVARLTEIGQRLGFVTIPVAAVVCRDNSPISSTRIRALIIEGDVSTAHELMGHPYTLSGETIAGEGLGHRIGFPTLNLKWPEQKLLPATGVYATLACAAGHIEQSVTHIGYRPTVNGQSLSVETHLIDPRAVPGKGDAAYNSITLQFVERLRPEQTFASVEALAEQIRRDVRAAKVRLAGKDGEWQSNLGLQLRPEKEERLWSIRPRTGSTDHRSPVSQGVGCHAS